MKNEVCPWAMSLLMAVCAVLSFYTGGIESAAGWAMASATWLYVWLGNYRQNLRKIMKRFNKPRYPQPDFCILPDEESGIGGGTGWNRALTLEEISALADDASNDQYKRPD